MRRRQLRFSLAVGIGSILLTLLLASVLWLTECPSPRVGLSNDRPYPVHILFYSWHSAIAWEQKNLPPQLRAMGAEEWRNAPIVEVGWGDRGFYFERDESWLSILRMAVTGSPSVIHVASFAKLPDLPRRTVYLDQKGLLRLVSFVAGTFKVDAHHNRRLLGKGQYGTSNFYAAVPPYSLWYNCNGWTAEALHLAGLRLCSRRIFTIQHLQSALDTAY